MTKGCQTRSKLRRRHAGEIEEGDGEDRNDGKGLYDGHNLVNGLLRTNDLLQFWMPIAKVAKLQQPPT